MSAMMMTNMTSRMTFSRAGSDACKLRSKVHRAPFVAGQAKHKRVAVVSAQAQKVRAALLHHIRHNAATSGLCGLISFVVYSEADSFFACRSGSPAGQRCYQLRQHR